MLDARGSLFRLTLRAFFRRPIRREYYSINHGRHSAKDPKKGGSLRFFKSSGLMNATSFVGGHERGGGGGRGKHLHELPARARISMS